MTLLSEMPIKEEETDNVFWGAVDLALSQLSIEFSQTKRVGRSEEKTPSWVARTPKWTSLVVHPIPVVKTSNRTSSGQWASSKPGPNHLNLIQIKGAVAHAFQPRLVQEGRGGRAVVVDPLKHHPLAYSNLNKILLSSPTTVSKK